ncbi:MAG: valine--tRNA ligase [Galactobacillus timonensis]|uniref:valine--tRNA ligase n=1 Tax=Galactobacillus timonensis TaxID=2041840 RepID=UPI0023F4AC27|nr:valine--tRNA ligase [Galactobacillus timonensis]MCI6068449.1 valine--tRNA ligase [Galactobacillus timonensis]MCI6753877.1 valine--tRNA ligase [Galactobacillus timonensis]MDD7087761.1 valine--tRNA ligase [Galactobacillus timonensis]MDY5221846.1 valine--tRNA ligase [Lachnospiraceae bacterium]
MKKELAAKYDHKAVEDGRYDKWVRAGYFTAGDKSKDPFTIVIPPPNVTGILHLGHAWDNTLQDIICRYKRMKGYDVLYLPGMDHAGIATQAKVDARLKSEGISRYDIGREKFLDRAWEWKEEYAATIRKQWAKLGNSLDYSRERFTMDEGFNKAVRHVFVTLYNEGLIYRGWRIINWDPEARTALSNIEVIYQEDPGKMYYMNYETVEDHEHFIVATTRPETMFGDVCIVVNPNDEKRKHLIGKHCINPANGQQLPIIGDDYIDMDFGTAIMKCTPAHDPNDFAIAERHGLDKPICMNPDGTMNEICGKYAGMDRYACRDALVEDFTQRGVMDHIENITHQVGHSERTHCVVEPYLSQQWFVKMKPLAQDVLDHQKDPDSRINFYPERFNKTFTQWLENIEDWCISRQLWWGHRIPAWYNKTTGETYVGEEGPKDPENWTQDEDVLDTWFSSALWPFATLGWPEETDDYKRYYPTSTMVTGYDIIFFWVARMAFQGRHFTKERPFKDVLIHGLIRDSQGRKMSKSLGNGIDPMQVIDQYGVDALRFFLATNSTPGQDMRYIPEKVEAAWNFINKLWNASRFVLMNLDEEMKPEDVDLSHLSEADAWILARLNTVLDHLNENMEKYEFALVGNELYSFVWDDFCSWYIEMSKASLQSSDEEVRKAAKSTLFVMLNAIVRLLHPFMPFVTEEIYLALPHEKESICLETWPEKVAGVPMGHIAEMDRVVSVISKLRELKNDNGLKPSRRLSFILKDLDGNVIPVEENQKAMIDRMAKSDWVDHLDGDLTVATVTGGSINIPSQELLDVEEEKKKLTSERVRLEGEVARSTKILSNPGFLAKAPAAKVEAEKAKLADYEKQLAVVIARFEAIAK